MTALTALLLAILLLACLFAGYWLRVWVASHNAPVDPAPPSEWSGEVVSFPNAYNVRVVSEDE